jgi:hypothetical protein
MDQVVKCLCCKCKALSSNPYTAKKKKLFPISLPLPHHNNPGYDFDMFTFSLMLANMLLDTGGH